MERGDVPYIWIRRWILGSEGCGALAVAEVMSWNRLELYRPAHLYPQNSTSGLSDQ